MVTVPFPPGRGAIRELIGPSRRIYSILPDGSDRLEAMDDFDLRTLGRKMLLFVAILSVLVMGEMILVSAEEPIGPVQQQTAYSAPR